MNGCKPSYIKVKAKSPKNTTVNSSLQEKPSESYMCTISTAMCVCMLALNEKRTHVPIINYSKATFCHSAVSVKWFHFSYNKTMDQKTGQQTFNIKEGERKLRIFTSSFRQTCKKNRQGWKPSYLYLIKSRLSFRSRIVTGFLTW